MKKALLVAAAMICVAAPATAADMPLKAPPPVVAATVYNWTGFYIGAHCGGAWGRTRHTGDDGAYDEAGSETYNLNANGVICGGQIGYNVQRGSWLFGLELQAGYLGAKESIVELADPDNLNEVKYRGYGAFTGRVGFVNNNWLFYGKGGAAVARIRNQAGDIVDGTSDFDPVDGVIISKTRFGWTAGGGVEWGFAPNWSVRAEYLFLNFGTFNAVNSEGDTFTFRNHVHTGTIGINYRWGGAAPVVARY